MSRLIVRVLNLYPISYNKCTLYWKDGVCIQPRTGVTLLIRKVPDYPTIEVALKYVVVIVVVSDCFGIVNLVQIWNQRVCRGEESLEKDYFLLMESMKVLLGEWPHLETKQGAKCFECLSSKQVFFFFCKFACSSHGFFFC